MSPQVPGMMMLAGGVASIAYGLLAGGVASIAYGLLEVLAPGLPIRWQVRSTEKHRGDFRGVVGNAFQRWLSIDPSAEPWNDPSARRRIRFLGLALISSGAIFVAIGVWMLAR